MTLLIVSILCLTLLSQSVWAFSDTQTDVNADKIASLKEAGILLGGPDGTFNPNEDLTHAAGVSMIVKGLDVSLARFYSTVAPLSDYISAPNDYFTNMSNSAWFAEAFITAHLNGIDIPSDVNPEQAMTREQFAHLLSQAIDLNGPYPVKLMYAIVKDEADISPDYSASIQKLILTDIVSLDEENKFHPKAKITRSEAAGWLYDAIEFVKTTPAISLELDITPPNPFYQMELGIVPVNDDVNEVTVSAQAPHPGYGLRIASIVFDDDQAIIYTEAQLPDPDMMYPQVIVEVKAVTYISSEYKPVLADAGKPGRIIKPIEKLIIE